METAVASLTSRLEKLSTRLESVERQLAQGPPAAAAAAPTMGAAAPAADVEAGPAQTEFDELVATHIKSGLDAAKAVSPVLAEQLGKFLEACAELSRIIGAASRSAKPASMEALQTLAKPLVDKAQEVAAYKDKFGRDKAFNNIAGVAEAAACLSWIFVEPKPAPFLAEVAPGAEFYLNRVLTATKGKDEPQFKWAREFIAFLKNLQVYVKKHHTTGLAFNVRGGSLESALATSSAPSGGAPPPPPPPPPPGLLADMPPAPAPTTGKIAGADMGAVMSAINRGTDISKGLKHVTAEQKTKNRTEEERASGNIQPKEKTPAAAAEKKKETKAAKPPSKVHSGNKWMIENFTEGQIVIDDTRLNDMVYIGNCKNCTVQIKGKINGVTIDGCTKVGVVCENIVAVIELVNCNSVQLQVTGKTPTVNIDKCNGVQLFVSQAAADPENPTKIFTSKCSSVNVLIASEDPEADPTEAPVPEQFLTIIRGKALVTHPAGMEF